MIRYRAILLDPANTTAERANQIFGNDLPTVEAWARAVVAKAVGKDSHVIIYENQEHFVRRIDRQEK
jgi:hypothetical protein